MKYSKYVTPTVSLLSIMMTVQMSLAQEVKFERKFKKGDVTKYKLTSKQQNVSDLYPRGGFMLITEHSATWTVDSIYSDGSADVTVVLGDFVTRVNQEQVPNPGSELMDGVPYTVRVSPNSLYLDVRGSKDLSSKQLERIEEIKDQLKREKGLPTNPLKIGESWKDESAVSYDLPSFRFDRILNLKFTFVGFDKYEGTECAVLRISGDLSGTQSGEEFEVSFKGTARGTQFYDINEGKFLRVFLDFDAAALVETKKGPKEIKITASEKIEIVK